jgi:DNA polymerase-1
VHFNPDHDTHPRVIAENEANYAHMMQTLCGDSTDGYSGCPGVGPKKAEAILANGHTWDLVLDAFRKAGLSEDEALVQARVARILRHHEFDQRTSEVKLWTPATSS